ncbi:MAG: oxidoreductase [Candidatus Bathyarchaeia archaeon]
MGRDVLNLAIGLGATCSGCDVTIVDLAEYLPKVLSSVNIVFWPTAADLKRKDLEARGDGSRDLALYHGAIVNEENAEIARLLRRKSKLMVAFGSCACFGGIPGLANLAAKDILLETVYGTPSTDNPRGIKPQGEAVVGGYRMAVPKRLDAVLPLSGVAEVDYSIPGCPPQTSQVRDAFKAILSGNLPPKGSIIGPAKNLCDECPRKREEKSIPKIVRSHEIIADQERCLLDQGLLCMGPATRAGCGAKCIKANMRCEGCMGPPDGVRDQGAKMLSTIASILGLEGEDRMSEEEVARLMEGIADPVGLLYLFSLPSSILRRKLGEV